MLGQPDVVEHAGAPFTRYASSGCGVAVRSDGGMRTGWAWIPKPGRWSWLLPITCS
ncbi:protein of unknown function [Stenotrophomonas maltophilia]|nr:protein of unknown function [Stenotrophomonas maltophilia]